MRQAVPALPKLSNQLIGQALIRGAEPAGSEIARTDATNAVRERAFAP
ncbi:hypothetical protein BZL29_5896 [Mycobacterium kansasii]|uniref:Uncharacterized protein n=1 Tax=Mycobacterium kansasii TaxID=1768 RepID=A0A1V3WXM0_MYCKA|nr:hypothetical protein BZL29_5896 [Mycobacterium kansasii]